MKQHTGSDDRSRRHHARARGRNHWPDLGELEGFQPVATLVSRRPARFTEADVRRAAKVAKELGMLVEITPDGTIRLVPVETKGVAQTDTPKQEREIVL